MNKTAKKFWKTRNEYPPFIYKSQRRYLDLGTVLKYINNINSVLDLGCGEGQLLIMLRELTNIKNYYGYDLSTVFIKDLINRWGNYSGLNTQATDFTTLDMFPNTDLCLCMGVFPYVFDDEVLKHVLLNITSKLFITRIPCTLGQKRIEINKFSEDLGDRYAAVYRTIPEYISILSEFFNIKSINRCYPNEIESGYGSKQFFFVCERRKDNGKN